MLDYYLRMDEQRWKIIFRIARKEPGSIKSYTITASRQSIRVPYRLQQRIIYNRNLSFTWSLDQDYRSHERIKLAIGNRTDSLQDGSMGFYPDKLESSFNSDINKNYLSRDMNLHFSFFSNATFIFSMIFLSTSFKVLQIATII